MLKIGHQNNAITETQEVFNKFDNICDKIKVNIIITMKLLHFLNILYLINFRNYSMNGNNNIKIIKLIKKHMKS